MKKTYTGKFWVNEGDPYEPMGILFKPDKNSPIQGGDGRLCFARLLRHDFGLEQSEYPVGGKPEGMVRLTVTIEKE